MLNQWNVCVREIRNQSLEERESKILHSRKQKKMDVKMQWYYVQTFLNICTYINISCLCPPLLSNIRHRAEV